MCLLIFKPAGKTITEAAFKKGFQSNSHGGGFAWSTGKQVWYKKPFWTADAMWEDIQQYFKYPMIIHFRITTHGGNSKDNTHPHDAGGGWIMGHNGIIPQMECLPQESDTRAYIRTTLRPLLRRHTELPLDPRFKQIVASQIGGSKLVFLRANGDNVIVNEGMGDWDDGVWYSNRSYKEWRSRTTTYQGGTGYVGSNWYEGSYLPDEITPYWKSRGITDNHNVRPGKKKTNPQQNHSQSSEMREHMEALYGSPFHSMEDLVEQERVEYERQLDAELHAHTKSEGIVLPNFSRGECNVTDNAAFFCFMCKKHFESAICYESAFDGTCWCSKCHEQASIYVS